MSPCDAVIMVDAWVQKRFDGAVHELMRRTGATKRSIRRNAWGWIMTTAIASIFVDSGPRGEAALYAGLTLISFTAIVLIDDHADDQAERAADTVSRADAYRTWPKVFAVFGLVFLALAGYESLYTAMRAASDLGWLFIGYLAGTPPQAPKKQDKRVPSAVPEAA